jgi:hypothetical protein
MRRCAVVVAVLLLLALIGCKEETFNGRLAADVAVNQKKQEREIATISGKVEQLEKTLAEIQKSLEKPVAAIGTPPPAASTEGSGVDFRSTQEYAQMVAALSEMQEMRRQIVEERAQQELRDPRQAFQAMGNPQEMDRRLTLLSQNFVSRIEDPAKRQQFEADLQQLRQTIATPMSVNELYQRRTAELTARLNEEQDERRKEFIQRELTSLQSATAEQLEQTLDRYQRSSTMSQLRQLQQTYDIPRDVLQNSGIPTMGGGDRGGFQRGQRGQRGPGR